MKWKKGEILIVVLLGLVVAAAVFFLCMIFREYALGDSIYKELEAYVFLPEESDESGLPSPQPDGTQDDGAFAAAPEVDFASLSAQNDDCIGWIYIPDTTVNYPIVQGDDNIYYQSHTFNKVSNNCGSIFLDALNASDFSDQNHVIYGHHMKNGSMFAGICKYTTQDYYDAHPFFWLVTPQKTYRVSIFSGFLTDTESSVWQLTFTSADAYQDWLDQMCRNSYFKSDVVPGSSDRIVTLATCSYEYDDARFVLMGILQEE